MSDSRLFQPLQVGEMHLQHRIGMAPMTRMRASHDRIPSSVMEEYYSQRASVPGTVIFSEGTLISAEASGGFACAPGIWSQEQVTAWRRITDRVHSKHCFMICQIFAFGRAANAELAGQEGIRVVGPSSMPIQEGGHVPDELTRDEIEQIQRDFVAAAENAIAAGFDAVEFHCANGYLADQFLQDTSNRRTDQYGGSVENRSRFVQETVCAISQAIGPSRLGIRLSPWSPYQGMGMEDPIPQFTDIIQKARASNIGFINLIESRVSGSDDREGPDDRQSRDSLNFAYDLWDGTFFVAGGYGVDEARRLVDARFPGKDIVVMFGRHFISNPDLVYRAKHGMKLAKYNRETFYTNTKEGYVDYPFSAGFQAGNG